LPAKQDFSRVTTICSQDFDNLTIMLGSARQ
jgi:hypothetical protein